MTIKDYTEYKEAEILRLYAEVGWTAIGLAIGTYLNWLLVAKRLRVYSQRCRNSITIPDFFSNRYRDDKHVLMGDGHTIIFVQDILVRPDYQRQGIGSALLRAVLERYADVRQIELVTDNTPETRVFYQSAGFQELSEIDCCGFMKT